MRHSSSSGRSSSSDSRTVRLRCRVLRFAVTVMSVSGLLFRPRCIVSWRFDGTRTPGFVAFRRYSWAFRGVSTVGCNLKGAMPQTSRSILMTEDLREQASRTRIEHARSSAMRAQKADALGSGGEERGGRRRRDGQAEVTIVARASHGGRGGHRGGRIERAQSRSVAASDAIARGEGRARGTCACPGAESCARNGAVSHFVHGGSLQSDPPREKFK